MPETTWSDGDVATAALLNQIEDQIVVTCTSTTRPTGAQGRFIYETDTDRLMMYTGSAWILASGTPVSFTPQLQAVTTNPTLGTGSTQVGRYSRSGVGGRVDGFGEIQFGTSGVAAGNGTYRVTLPIGASTTIHKASGSGGSGACIGSWVANDNSAGFSSGVLQLNATSSALLLAGTVAVSNTSPWAWNTSDGIQYTFSYYPA